MSRLVRLERLRPEHAAEMLAGLGADEGYRFLPDDPPAGLAELTCRYERQARGQSDDGAELWHNWIVRDADTGSAMGYTQATVLKRSALIGYHIFPAHWRTGVGYAALLETLNLMFLRLDVDLAWALVDTRNAASVALLRKLGFSVTGHHEKADYFKGAPSDEWKFELQRSEWSAKIQTI